MASGVEVGETAAADVVVIVPLVVVTVPVPFVTSAAAPESGTTSKSANVVAPLPTICTLMPLAPLTCVLPKLNVPLLFR